jgi:hypothetical protein
VLLSACTTFVEGLLVVTAPGWMLGDEEVGQRVSAKHAWQTSGLQLPRTVVFNPINLIFLYTSVP